jgi:hypothetical protein
MSFKINGYFGSSPQFGQLRQPIMEALEGSQGF